MNGPPPFRLGWCPGALTPMASGDGLIVRIKPRGATLSIDQARGIAWAAARFGNGALDLTSRANLQIRGVQQDSLAPLTARLDALGLLDATAPAESVRNVVSSPLAGLDRRAVCDIRPIVSALERSLVLDTTLHGLPAKFGFAIDDGGGLCLRGVAADIAFEALFDQGRPAFAVRLGPFDAAPAMALIEADRLVPVAAALARIFLKVRQADPSLGRMRELAAAIGGTEILFAGVDLTPGPLRLPRRSFAIDQVIGQRHAAGAAAYGAAAPFGRLEAAQLAGLAAVAAEYGAADLRLTPWRAILLTGVAAADTGSIAQRLTAAGFITDPADPRLRVAACPGAPGCQRGTTPVLDDAALLAPLLDGAAAAFEGIALHVSGCAKGCAHAGRAGMTLVARDGAYHALRNARAGDAAMGPALSLDAVAQWVRDQAAARA